MEASAYLQRNPRKPEEANRLHKYYVKAYEYALQYFILTSVIRKLNPDEEDVLGDIFCKWINQFKENADFVADVKKITKLAKTNTQFYVISAALHKTVKFDYYCPKSNIIFFFSLALSSLKCPNQYQSLILEVFFRGLTNELNELELMKADGDKDEHTIMQTELQIAPRYIFLAEVLESHKELARECILTAFSLSPTEELFKRVKSFAIQSNLCSDTSPNDKQMVVCKLPDRPEIKCPIHVVSQPNCPTCDIAAVELEPNRLESCKYDASAAATNLTLESDVITESVKRDLSVVISSPRVKTLSWLLEWKDLESNCLILLSDKAKLEMISKTVATANDRLKFLNLDYNQFRHLTQMEYPGIEKGYEMFCYDEDEDDESNLSGKICYLFPVFFWVFLWL